MDNPATGPPPQPSKAGNPPRWLRILIHTAAAAFFAYCCWLTSQPYGRIVESPKRTEARVLGKNIADAITQFYGDYGKLPVSSGQTAGGVDLSTDTSGPSGLIRILLGKEPDGASMQNTRNINYLEGMKAAKRGRVQGGPPWLGGLVLNNGDPAAVDSWGNFFQVRLDTNGDGAVENPNLEEIADGRLILPCKVLIWSSGRDSKEETWEDNVKTWD